MQGFEADAGARRSDVFGVEPRAEAAVRRHLRRHGILVRNARRYMTLCRALGCERLLDMCGSGRCPRFYRLAGQAVLAGLVRWRDIRLQTVAGFPRLCNVL